MTDRDALLAAIRTHPDEDTPRLAFADYLDEQGKKPDLFQADFIRTACRLARLEPWADDRPEVHTHYRKLLRRVPDAWTAHLKGRAITSSLERGFVGHITVYSKRFVAEGEKFFAADPVRSVKFAKLNSERGSVSPAELFACSALARIATLKLEGAGLKDGDLTRLAASPHSAGLRTLHLGGDQAYTRNGLPKLLAAMPGVTELQVWAGATFQDQHARALAASPALANLTRLNLLNVRVEAPAAVALLLSPYAANLKRLQIIPAGEYDEEHGTPFGRGMSRAAGRAVAEALAASTTLTSLESLDLSNWSIGNDGLGVLGEARLPALRHLVLEGNLITKKGATAFAKSPLAARLKLLDLAWNELQELAGSIGELYPHARVRVNHDVE